MPSEIFQIIKPKNEFLKKHINSFYFHKVDKDTGTSNIVSFPNTKNELTIYGGAKLNLLETKYKHVKITNHYLENYLILYGGIQQNYVISEIIPPFNKIGVIFEPLGINYFINTPYLGREVRSDYNFQCIRKKITPILEPLYNTTESEKKLEILENFFMSQINMKFEEPILEKAIYIIENYHGSLKIIEVANLLNVDKNTIIRKFRNHLNCTPKHYSKVQKFRRALTADLEITENKSLTDLSLNNNYYDQSDFIKSFKSLTGRKPSFFLNKLMIWEMIFIGSNKMYFFYNFHKNDKSNYAS